MAGFMTAVKDLVPASVRARVRSSRVWRRKYNRRHAMELATRSKRLDICAAQMAHLLHLAFPVSSARQSPLAGKVCLEVGCGWILTHALICHLLGAKRVLATDIEVMARPDYLPLAIEGAVQYLVRDVLSPFAPHDEIRHRLDRLRSLERYDFESLEGLGIEYIAPVDLAQRALHRPVDFIYSLSVLEHVPVDDIPSLLSHLSADLSPGGHMIHAIHLEDHRDIQNHPFPFLAESGASFGRQQQSDHGNRLRRSTWHHLFAEQSALQTRFLYEFSRLEKPLPDTIDPSVSHQGEDDLRISHLGVFSTKEGIAVEGPQRGADL